MNEHTGPYVDSKSRHRMSQESKEPKKKTIARAKKNDGTKTKEETGKYSSDFSFHNYLAFLLSTF